MRNTWVVLPLTPLSPLGGETMSEKTCCPNAQLHSRYTMPHSRYTSHNAHWRKAAQQIHITQCHTVDTQCCTVDTQCRTVDTHSGENPTHTTLCIKRCCSALLESIALLWMGRSADALSTALLTQTELSITVGEEVAELWTFGRAHTRAPKNQNLDALQERFHKQSYQ